VDVPGRRVRDDAGMVLTCTGLAKAFGDRRAVDGLSFRVAAGEAYGLLGPNGAGKTTTIRMVCGILAPDRGRVTVEGSLGYVPQDLALLPTLTVMENLRFWDRVQGLPRRGRRDRTAEVLDVVGLAGRAGERVERCSGGMQRRLNLAVALLHRPRLLVLDEPTVGVDTQSRASILATLARMRERGTALLYTSHYMDEVERLCDRVGVVDHGHLVEEGPPADLLRARPELADLEGLFLELTGRELRD
jgi:ABC-2 type transport system ATP-binding protein